MDPLNEQDWRRLTESIRRKKCVLVLGPRAAVDPRDMNAGELPRQLARELGAGLIDQNGPVDADNLSQIAQHYQNDHDRLDLEIAIEDFFKPFADVTSQLHRDLAALPFSLCINLFYDRFMLNALIEREEKTPAFDYYHFREVRTAGSEPDEQAPLAFNLFGDTGDPESLVASENDLLDFLVRVLSRNPPLQSNLTSLLSAEQGRKFTFLFLGMGFQQWHIRILLHALGMLRHKQPSLAVEDARFFEHPDRPATALFFEQQHKIAFRQINALSAVMVKPNPVSSPSP